MLHQPSPTESARWGCPLTLRPGRFAGLSKLRKGVRFGRKPGHTQVAMFPKLSLILLYLVSFQIQCRFYLLPLFSCCHQLGPGPPFLLLSLPLRASYQLPLCRPFLNQPTAVLTARETQPGSFHCLLRNRQSLPSTYWTKCNMPHPNI